MPMSMGSYASRVVATAVVATDGTGDFTDIQTAIDSLPAGGGVVYVKEGTYTISAAIEIYKPNVALFGSGAATLITLANATDDNGIEIGDGASAYANIVVADLKLDGNSANQTGTSTGIRITATSTDCKVQRCWVDDFKTRGIVIAATADKCLITECTVSNATVDGMQIAGSTEGNIISNNICYSNTRNGIWVGVGQNLVEGNICYGNGPDALSLGAGIHLEFSGNLVTGNLCSDNYYAEIVVWAATEKNTVTGNFCYNSRGNGIDIFGNHTVCTGNTVQGCDYRGIYCDSDYNTITGNQAVNNGQLGAGNLYSGIELSNADYNTVTGNQCNDDRGASNEQKYGIVETGTSDYNLILGNFAQGNVTAATLVIGTNTVEAYTNAVAPAAALKYVASDLTEATHTGDANETTMSTLTIPANTVKTGIIIRANGYRWGTTNDVTWRIKVGATGSEATKVTQTQGVGNVGDIDHKKWVSLQWYESAQTWTADVTVLVTVQQATAGDHTGLQTVIIEGY